MKLRFAIVCAFALATSNAMAGERMISQDELGNDWPFTVSEGLLKCEGRLDGLGPVTTFTANGKTYAVSSLAGMRGYADIKPIWREDTEQIKVMAKLLKMTIEEYKAHTRKKWGEDSLVHINIGPVMEAGKELCK